MKTNILDKELPLKKLMIITTVSVGMGLCRDGIPVLFPFIKETFALSRAKMGLFNTFLFMSSTLASIFTGYVVDILGARRSMSIGILSLGVIVLSFSLTPYFFVMLLLAFLMGGGLSLITPSTSKAVMISVGDKIRGTSMGIVQSGIGVGSLIGAITLPYLGKNFGWRTALIFPAVLSMLASFIIFNYFRDIREKEVETEESSRVSLDSFKSIFLKLFKNKDFFLICIFGLVIGSVFGSANTHFTVYLTEDRGLNVALAGMGFGILHLGSTLGRFGWGFISDKLFKGRRGRTFLLMGVFTSGTSLIFSLLAASLLNIPILLLFSIIFIFGFSCIGFFGLYATAVGEVGGRANTGMAVGIAVLFPRLGMMVSSPVFGYLADLQGTYYWSWLLAGLLTLIMTLLINYFISEDF